MDPLAPLSPRQIRQQANLLLSSSLARPRSQILQAQAQARMQAQQDAQMIQGFSSAVASLLGHAGPATDQVYSQAADRQAKIAQGYALGQQLAEQHTADQANAFLAQQGQTAHISAGPASQVTYALGGANPATYLNQTGAAFSAAAHGLPAMAAGRGQQLQAQRLSQGETEQAKLRAQLTDLMSQAPGLRQKILDSLYQREISKQATLGNLSYLGIRSNYANSQARKNIAQVTGTDPVTGNPIYNPKAGANASKQVLAARKARMGAYDQARNNSFNLATTLYKGSPNPGGKFLPPVKPTYQEAYGKIWNRYGQPIMRYAPPGNRAWWKRQVDAFIHNALQQAGFRTQFAPTRPG